LREGKLVRVRERYFAPRIGERGKNKLRRRKRERSKSLGTFGIGEGRDRKKEREGKEPQSNSWGGEEKFFVLEQDGAIRFLRQEKDIALDIGQKEGEGGDSTLTGNFYLATILKYIPFPKGKKAST